MQCSRKIMVVKRDGSVEPFDLYKLAASVWRVSRSSGRTCKEAIDLSRGIELYLVRRLHLRVDTSLLSRLLRKVMVHAGFAGTTALQLHTHIRRQRRTELFIAHRGGRRIAWDKTWLARMVENTWDVSRPVARIIAGEVEMELLESSRKMFSRRELVAMVNDRVSAFGLADAVSIRQFEMEE